MNFARMASSLGAALLGFALAAPASAAAPARAVVPFIEDDLARALAEAKKSDRPIFVESWAPW